MTEQRLVDEILEIDIYRAGKQAELAMKRGEPALARQWSQEMYRLIAARSPAQLERMQQVVDQGVGYFTSAAAGPNRGVRRMLAGRGL